MRPTRPKAFLLDADVVIYLHAVGLWAPLCEQVEVCLPSIVARIEVRHYVDPEAAELIEIDLKGDIGSGRVSEFSASTDELRALDRLGRMALGGLHEGEREALALVCSGRLPPGCALCSGDQAALRAAVMLGHESRCSSLEGVLRSAGMDRAFADNDQFGEVRFRGYVKPAAAEHVHRLLDGLSGPGGR